ncbi:MAG: phage tail assembly chaperone, partial [Synergistaceae bacterium]
LAGCFKPFAAGNLEDETDPEHRDDAGDDRSLPEKDGRGKGDYWERAIYRGLVELGLKPWEFWQLAPNELDALYFHQSQEIQRMNNLAERIGWLSAALSRSKDLGSMRDTIFGEQKPTSKIVIKNINKLAEKHGLKTFSE